MEEKRRKKSPATVEHASRLLKHLVDFDNSAAQKTVNYDMWS